MRSARYCGNVPRRSWIIGRSHILRRFFPSGAEARRNVFGELGDILTIRSIMLINLALYQQAVSFTPDLVYCNDLDTLLTGVLFKVRHNTTLCYDAHEIYPEQFAEHMRSDLWYQFYSGLEHRLLSYTDGRVTVCNSLGDYFRKTYHAEPFLTVRNTPSIRYLPDASILERRNRPVRVFYHGNYFQYRGLDEIIAIAGEVDDAVFAFRGMGDHESQLRAQVAMRNLEHRVRFEEPVTIDELIPMASLCDVGLSPFISVCLNTEYALPNKFFEYMMAGMALASADLVEMRLLTQHLDNGLLFAPYNSEDIARSLKRLVLDQERLHFYRRQSYEAARAEFHWENEEKKLQRFLRQLP